MDSLTPDAVLLGLLMIAPRHGYDLIHTFESADELGRVWQMSTSQVYAVLKRLERTGMIVGETRTTEHAPPRTLYTLTDAGRLHFLSWLHIEKPPSSVRRVRVEFLSRLFLARALNLPTLEIVRRQRQACQHYYDLLTEQRAGAAPGIEYLAVEFEMYQIAAIVDWLARVELAPHPSGENDL
ncbi:MAG: PadR family transcriptional regulator [bacterium]|nr:PadR family transcriptional regulator [bacterium]